MPTRPKRDDGTTTYFGIDEIVGKAEQFLEYCERNELAPTIVEFEKYLGVNHSYISDLPSSHSASVKLINKMFENFHTQKGLNGEYNTPFHIFYMKNKFNWSDKREVKQEVNQVNRVMPSNPDE